MEPSHDKRFTLLQAKRFQRCVVDHWGAVRVAAACRYSDPGLSGYAERFPFAVFYVLGAVIQTGNSCLLKIFLDSVVPAGEFSGDGIYETVFGGSDMLWHHPFRGASTLSDMLWQTLLEGAEETAGFAIARDKPRVPVRSTARNFGFGQEPLPMSDGLRYGLRICVEKTELAAKAAAALFETGGGARAALETGSGDRAFEIAVRTALETGGGDRVKNWFAEREQAIIAKENSVASEAGASNVVAGKAARAEQEEEGSGPGEPDAKRQRVG